MSSLNGAVSLVQVHHVAVQVANDLHLDVSRLLHVLLQEQRPVTERCLRLRARSLERLAHFLYMYTHSKTHYASHTRHQLYPFTFRLITRVNYVTPR